MFSTLAILFFRIYIYANSYTIILENLENPIVISDSDGDEDWVPPSARELAERRRINRAVKEEPKETILKSVPVKHEF